ncbi:MAG: hypothetical protein J6C19_00050 [Lachnospiraceae bacterium]|nr:hypothetical protein [Lachnospiraceae bacterium]
MFRNFGKNRHGIITVFVVLIMVPVVVITGIMVDVARLKLFAVQTAYASDSYGDVILSEYDNLLKELYGLFSVTQNEAGLKAIDDYADYIGYSFKPNGDRSELSGSMFFSDADVLFQYEKIEASSLTNENVFMTQVADYMEFRIVGQVINEMGDVDDGVFDMIEQFNKMEEDNEAIDAFNDIGESSEKLLKEIDTYHSLLLSLKDYEKYLEDLKTAVGAYGGVLTEIYSSNDYVKYKKFLDNKDKILEAKREKEQLEAADEEVSEEIKELAEQYVDVETYRSEMRKKIDPKSKAAVDLLDRDLFRDIPRMIDELKKSAVKIENYITEIKEELEVLDKKLEKCSEDVRKGMEEDVKEMRTIADFSQMFIEVCLNEELKDNKGNNNRNKIYFHGLVYNGIDGYKALNVLANDIISGEIEGNVYWVDSAADVNKAEWWKIPEGPDSLYTKLQQLYDSNTEAGKKKKDADETKEAANNKTDDAVKQISEEEEDTEARDIPADVVNELKDCKSTGEVPSFFDYFKNGFSFKNAGQAGAAIYDKFLMTEYDFGMFSSRVTGIKEKSEGGDGSTETEKIVENSLNKVPMSKDINYLYGAELEYIYGGHAESQKNLAAARNTICGVRMTLNFISTYKIKEVNDAIKAIAQAAASAVSATGIGAFAAPLVKVAVSAALRSAVAALETVEDWKMLKNREDVLLFKSEFDELQCVDALGDILGPISKSSGGSSDTKRKKLKMSYEDYLRVLLFVCKDSGTIVSRTSDLITLNVNQSQNKEDVLSAPLAFHMSDTFTAVKTTCKAKLEMVVVPEYMLDLFLNGNDTQKQIQSYDDGYISYTMIRGY